MNGELLRLVRNLHREKVIDEEIVFLIRHREESCGQLYAVEHSAVWQSDQRGQDLLSDALALDDHRDRMTGTRA